MTKAFIGGRGVGKTLYCIKEASKNNYTIIVGTESQKRYVIKLAKEFNLEIAEPILINEWINSKKDNSTEYIIDEANLCLDMIGIKNITLDKEYCDIHV